MKFAVLQSDHYKPFEDYGLPTMAYEFYDEILTDKEEIAISDAISFRFSEIEINTIDDLIKFRDKCKSPIIIDKVDSFYPRMKKNYNYEIEIYNNYRE